MSDVIFLKFRFFKIKADGNSSTCSTSNNDMRRHLIISTTTSPSTGRATSTNSDFGTISTASPTTMSTIYQSIPNPYLTAVANDTPNVVRSKVSQ